jgi:hypothetical protein
LRLLLGVLLLLAVGACGDPFGSLPDGDQIDGIWVGPGDACQDGGDEGFCQALLTCAVQNEFGGADPGIDTWRVHGPPERLRDGTLVVYGGAVAIVAFDLRDGTRRATSVMETDRCR